MTPPTDAAPDAAPGAAPLAARGRRTAVTGLALVVLAGAALESFLLPALPHLQRAFGVDAATGALAQVAPPLVTVVVTPLAGRFADVHGARRTLAVLVSIVTAGGLVSALAPGFPLFVLGQALQGFALGVLPAAFVVVRGLYSDEGIKTASGGLVALTVAGAGLGVLVAGPIIEATSRTVLFGIPTAVVVVGSVVFFASRVRLGTREPEGPTRVDWAGASTLALALLATVAWLASTSSAGWLAPATLALFVVAGALVSGWVLVERRVAQPMIDLDTLRSRAVGGSVAVGVGIGAGYASLVFLVPQQISRSVEESGLGAGATQTGFFLAAAFGAGFVASPLAGRAAARLGVRAVGVAGMLVLATGALVAAVSPAPAAIVWALVCAGVGAGSASTVAFSAAATGTPEHEVGVATAFVTIGRAVGGALATQVVASIVPASDPTGSGMPGTEGFRVAYLLVMCIALGGAATAMLLPKDAHRNAPTAVRA
ncbi:MFS transporter [Myceligenerans indicum]|uniref:MFS transporter n=1 Tax=Myceligenerans indicum TaxID=2593663 RepID=A0ABS1LG68_9MICO|nr:MFS transporter [Myceligenerans indicum]MBL0885191.1 MFS transporter [Myceligenerans indicum]